MPGCFQNRDTEQTCRTYIERQIQPLGPQLLIFTASEQLRHRHRRRLHLGRRARVEVAGHRLGLVERLRPHALEVDHVGEHHLRATRDGFSSDQLRDATFRLEFDPVVDAVGGALRLLEVDLLGGGVKMRVEDAAEGGEDVEVGVHEDLVGDFQFGFVFSFL